MKRIFLSLLLPATLLVVPFGAAQTSDTNQEQKLLALIKDLQAQQAQMAENQKQIETKVAEIGETVRVARIYAGRSQ
jgi:outer membrane lipoprotein-sorting protein